MVFVHSQFNAICRLLWNPVLFSINYILFRISVFVFTFFSIHWTERQIRCVKWTSINSTCFISSPNPMFDHLLESSRWDDSNKWSNKGFGQEIDILEMKICALVTEHLCVKPYYRIFLDTVKPQGAFCNAASLCNDLSKFPCVIFIALFS